MGKVYLWIISNQSVELIRVSQCLTSPRISKPPIFLIVFSKKKSNLPSQQTAPKSHKHPNFTKKEQKHHTMIHKKKHAGAERALAKIQTKTSDIGAYKKIRDTIGSYRSTITTSWTNTCAGWIKSSNRWPPSWARGKQSNAAATIKRWKKSLTVPFAKYYYIYENSTTPPNAPVFWRRKSSRIASRLALGSSLKSFYCRTIKGNKKKSWIHAWRKGK